jgi:anthranilate synthase component I
MYYPSLEEAVKLSSAYNIIPIVHEINAGKETPLSLFQRINTEGNSFLLESIKVGESTARHSYIGTSLHTIYTTPGTSPDPLAQVETLLKNRRAAPIAGLPAFCGGVIGYVGYEAAASFEKLPIPVKDDIGLPVSAFMLVDTFLIYDNATRTIKIVSCISTENLKRSYQLAEETINSLVARINQPLPDVTHNDMVDTKQPSITSPMSREDFESGVSKIKDYITAGEAIQVVLSRRLSRATVSSSFEIYSALREVNPSPYMYYLDFKDFQVIGASPEILVKVEERNVITRPLAGTRPRGITRIDDIRLEEELKKDEKERAEHIMLVDLARNDIGRVSEPGTVEVSDLMNVERFSHVMHLVTHVRGKLKKELNAFDAFRACFPAGTVSGAPKIRAMEIIAEIESEKRGLYAGAAGYFSYNGNMDMAIAIRTIILKQGNAYIQSGCGVVYDSIPEREYEETLNKARALLKALDLAEARTKGV